MRHSATQITEKLRRAEALRAEGRTQKEIADTLGVSVMTFHRWRKAHPQALRSLTRAELQDDGPGDEPTTRRQGSRIADLQVENARLRKLVTDLLLEKMQLEEQAHAFSGRDQLKRAHR